VGKDGKTNTCDLVEGFLTKERFLSQDLVITNCFRSLRKNFGKAVNTFRAVRFPTFRGILMEPHLALITCTSPQCRTSPGIKKVERRLTCETRDTVCVCFVI
jgi:hypothetical protein